MTVISRNAPEQPVAPQTGRNIGCDYSSTTVYLGVVAGSKVLAVGSIQLGDSVKTFFSLLRDYLNALHEQHSTSQYIWIERPWMRSWDGKRGDTGLFMAKMAAYIEIASLEAGLEPQFIYPQTWRKTVYGHGRPQDLKDTAVSYVKDVLKYDVPVMGKTGRGKKPDHNLAEACCLATYGNILNSEPII